VDIEKLSDKLECIPHDSKICHIYSYSTIIDEHKLKVLFEKMKYMNENFMIQDNIPLMFVFSTPYDYLKFLKTCKSSQCTVEIPESIYFEELENHHTLANISDYPQFITYISGGFDARFFNSLTSDKYTVTKSSTNKEKIKAEYTFYHLLPENMQGWFVLPYNYQENKDSSSYTMERYNIT